MLAEPQAVLVRARERCSRKTCSRCERPLTSIMLTTQYPEVLTDLLNAQDKTRSYLRAIPKDPFTNARTDHRRPRGGTEGGTEAVQKTSLRAVQRRIFDVHSASRSSHWMDPYNECNATLFPGCAASLIVSAALFLLMIVLPSCCHSEKSLQHLCKISNITT